MNQASRSEDDAWRPSIGARPRWAAWIVALALAWPSPSAAQDAPAAQPPASQGAVDQAAATDPPATPARDDGPQGLLEIMFSGGIVGVLIMSALIALSLTAVYLVFDQFMTLRRKELVPQGLADAVRQCVAQGRVPEAAKLCNERPCMLSFVVLSGLAESDGDWAGVEKAMEDALAEQSASYFRRVEYLSVIGNLAPMLGLLGTVTGMILAFQQVASTKGAAGAGELAEGIYQALVTTVAGLVIAIPALGVFAVLRNRLDQLTAEAAYGAQHALAPLKRRGPSPPPWKGAGP